MDQQTKALLAKGMLHTSGLVVAQKNGPHLYTTITAFPPAMSVSVSDQLAAQVTSSDPDYLIAYVAKHIGQQVQRAVEQQILRAWKMSVQDAMAKVMEAKKTFLQDIVPWMPYDKKEDAVWKMPHLDAHFATSPPDAPWNDPEVDTLQSIKDALGKFEALENKPSVYNPNLTLLQNMTKALSPGTEDLLDTEAQVSAWTKPLHDAIPGFAKMRQPCPAEDCKRKFGDYWTSPYAFLQETIIHLNDHHHWTREAIADWLETLDHDLTFKIPEEVK